jgi:thiamine biosynthesis lipoprotein
MLLGIALIFSAPSAQANEYLTQEKALELAFPGADLITPQTVLLTKEQREQIGKMTQQTAVTPKFDYHTGLAKGVTQGYAVFGDASSKSDPFSYMLVLAPDCSIRMVEILTYSGIRGHEVRQKGFLNQFKGKTAQDKIQLRSDIKNMAGATISCQSLTDSIRQRMAYISVLLPPQTSNMNAKAEATLIPIVRETTPPGTNPAYYRRSQYLMGTLLEISVDTAYRTTVDKDVTAVFAEVARLEDVFSTFRPGSDTSRVNRAVPGTPTLVSDDFITLITHCRRMTEHTKDAFDVTVGPLVRLWKDAVKEDRLPPELVIMKAREAVGMRYLTFDTERRTVTRMRDGVYIDFGGIAKGYALDRAASILKKAGLTAVLLNFGGQYLAVGPPKDEPYWRIHVRHPDMSTDQTRALAELHLTTGSISTTGDYERGLFIGGRRYSHIINPRTGRPVSDMLSVTIVAETGMEADALSTGFFVMGVTDGLLYANLHETAVLMMDQKGELVQTTALLKYR